MDAKEAELLENIADPLERRRVQNRLSQRKHRKRIKDRLLELERRATAVPKSSHSPSPLFDEASHPPPVSTRSSTPNDLHLPLPEDSVGDSFDVSAMPWSRSSTRTNTSSPMHIDCPLFADPTFPNMEIPLFSPDPHYPSSTSDMFPPTPVQSQHQTPMMHSPSPRHSSVSPIPIGSGDGFMQIRVPKDSMLLIVPCDSATGERWSHLQAPESAPPAVSVSESSRQTQNFQRIL